MMESTTKQCHEMYISSPNKQRDSSTHKSPKRSNYAPKEEKRKSSVKEEKRPVSKKPSSFLKGNNKELLSPNKYNEKGKSMGAKLEEPKDLNVYCFKVLMLCNISALNEFKDISRSFT